MWRMVGNRGYRESLHHTHRFVIAVGGIVKSRDAFIGFAFSLLGAAIYGLSKQEIISFLIHEFTSERIVEIEGLAMGDIVSLPLREPLSKRFSEIEIESFVT